MNDLKLHAYGRVVQAIARHAFAMAGAEDDRLRHEFLEAPRPIYFHWFTSTFEAVTDDLSRLGILRPLEEYCPYFAFNCTIDELHIVAERNASAGPAPFVLPWLLSVGTDGF